MKQRKGLLLEQWPGMVFGPPSGTEMRFGRCQNWGVAIRDFRDTGWLFVAIYCITCTVRLSDPPRTGEELWTLFVRHPVCR